MTDGRRLPIFRSPFGARIKLQSKCSRKSQVVQAKNTVLQRRSEDFDDSHSTASATNTLNRSHYVNYNERVLVQSSPFCQKF